MFKCTGRWFKEALHWSIAVHALREVGSLKHVHTVPYARMVVTLAAAEVTAFTHPRRSNNRQRSFTPSLLGNMHIDTI